MTESSEPLNVEKTATSAKRRSTIWYGLALTAVIAATIMGIWSRNAAPEAHYRRARQALVEGEREIALHESDQLIHTAGYEAHGWLIKGLVLARTGKLDEAIANFQKASTNQSLAVEAHTDAARCYYESGRFLQAIDMAILALQQDTNCLDARRWLAAAYYDLGAVSQAVTELERIAEQAPRDPAPDRLLGLIAKDAEQYAAAIKHYRKSLERDSHQSGFENVLKELAESQVKLGQFDDALATLKDCRRSAAVLTLQANCQIGLGHFDEAKDQLREALNLDPRNFPAMMALGKLDLDQGEPDDAVPVLSEAALIQPMNSQIHFQLAQALRGTGKPDEAEAEMRRMLEIQALEREFSDLHIKAGTEPTNAEIRFRTGELAILLGKPELATVWFRAALALNPNDTRARSALMRIQSFRPSH